MWDLKDLKIVYKVSNDNICIFTKNSTYFSKADAVIFNIGQSNISEEQMLHFNNVREKMKKSELWI